MLWLIMMYWQFIGNYWYTTYVKYWMRLVIIGKTLVHQIKRIRCYSNNMANAMKRMKLIGK